ncbi:HJR/Mrr/RecB family endonuclease [Sphingobium sp. OAS761]|uniref:restriction endonuclease n=1 Tax=Sphingobium sp. OAS761 TaxID=2817901 RepID=UPI0020A057CE|nr:restriction endonuclease [Sphingobium sp. OAS761]MCP1472002.1 HJR/Mrr/RecB family endonuclease [Sphingobium sp. OAS761]
MDVDDPIVVYQDFVELTCSDEDGNCDVSASLADQRRNGHRFRKPRTSKGFDYIGTSDQHQILLDEMDYNFTRRHSFGQLAVFTHCPHCKKPLSSTTHRHTEGFRDIYISRCANCGWWETEHTLLDQYDDYGLRCGIKSFQRRAVLKSFAVSSSAVPVENLCEYLASNPDKLEKVDPGKLEELVGHVFRETHHCDVRYVGGPNDRGIDLYLVKGDDEMAVQVKRRAIRRGGEPVSSVREFVGAMVIEQMLSGIFVTTGTFSPFARVAASRAMDSEVIEQIQLIDGKLLIEMCELGRPAEFDILTFPVADIEFNLSVYNSAVAIPVRGQSAN